MKYVFNHIEILYHIQQQALKMRLRNGKIIHKFNINAKEFVLKEKEVEEVKESKKHAKKHAKRRGKIKLTHRFNINAKEFRPCNVKDVKPAAEEKPAVDVPVRFEEKVYLNTEEKVYLNTITGQLIHMMATSKNLPKHLQPYEM